MLMLMLMLTLTLPTSYVSPRTRAQRTLELLEIGCKERLPWTEQRKSEKEEPIRTEATVEITEAIREWDYGDYEGLTSKQIRELREKNGEGPWDIWKDGCPGGEYDPTLFQACRLKPLRRGAAADEVKPNRSPEDVIRRLDALIAEIRAKYHSKCFEGSSGGKGDVLIVAHGHILRAFAMRWTGKPLSETTLILEAGGVGTLR